jgi:predicted anti-sigma-YlaC factor YlaD
MNCLECQDVLQDRLDGASGDQSEAERHLASCPACREWYAAARRLQEGVRFLAPAVPPAGLADRITGRVLAERRARLAWRGRRRTALALAASLLLALFVGRPQPPSPEPLSVAVGDRPAAPDKAVPPEPLGDSVAEAGSAVVDLTRRTADEAVGGGRLLLPVVVARAERPDADRPGPMDPPLRSLRTAGQGVSAGLEPVTSSARRAVDLFFHEIPAME